MKRAEKKRVSRLARLLTVAAIAAMALSAWTVSATDEDEKNVGYTEKIPFYDSLEQYNPGWAFRLLLGGVFFDTEGVEEIGGLSAGRAAEYRSVENSPLFGFGLMMDKGKNYAAVKHILFDKNDFFTEANSSLLDRVLISHARFDKYPHRLDNDLAADWAGSSTYTIDPGSAETETLIDVTVAKLDNRIKLPWLRGSTVYADIDTLWRSGHRQARTIDHCSSCHVTTKGQVLARRIWDLRLGAEVARAPYAIRYDHRYRTLEDNSEKLTYDYTNPFGNFDLEGSQQFAGGGNSTHISDSGAVRLDLGTSTSAIFKLRNSSTTNKTTGYQIDSNRLSGILAFKPVRWLGFKGRYNRLTWDNEVPNSASRNRNSFRATAIFRPARALRIEGSYLWDRVERSGGTEVEQTTTKSFRFKGTFRPERKLRLTAYWRHADVEDPFGRVLRNSFSRIDSVLLSPFGTNEDEFEAMLTYTPFAGSSAMLSYRWSNSENDTVNLKTTLQQFTAAGHVMLGGGAVLHGRIFIYDNNVERDVYLGVLAPLLEIVRVPFVGRGTSAQIGISLPLASKLLIRPSYGYVRAESGFGDSELGSGVAAPSKVDATINRFIFEAEYALTKSFNLLAVYDYNDYSDTAQPLGDGTVHWFYTGLTFRF